ncbi:MAG: SDR family oxidoreductase [Candidatus Kapaibacterium sp.]|nr:MAG: SDR family oxidoreductase [Candidatus Kapabacteria bacterium]
MIAIDCIGKTALVCGSTQGIGRAIAEALAEAGASVILAARNESALQAAYTELPTPSKQQHRYLVADFSRLENVQESMQHFLSKNNEPIHILVNNTGGPAPGTIHQASTDAFVQAFSQHLLCNQFLVQSLLPRMKEATYGRILNVISTSVKQPIPNLGVSNTIRGAVSSWAKTLSFELAQFGITVNNLLPGYIQTSRLDSLVQSTSKSKEIAEDAVISQMLQTIPAGRFGEARELAMLAAFLASPLAGYINGTSIAVDGGRTSAL